jgi:hypothetical protein
VLLLGVPRFRPWAGVPVRVRVLLGLEESISRIHVLRVRAAWPTFPAASDSVRHRTWAEPPGLYIPVASPPEPPKSQHRLPSPASPRSTGSFPCRRRAQSQSQLFEKREASPVSISCDGGRQTLLILGRLAARASGPCTQAAPLPSGSRPAGSSLPPMAP